MTVANAVEPETSEVPVSISTMEARTRGEIDIQIATAKRFPRSVAKCIKEALVLATMSEEVAEQCFYAVPRDGKTVEGPSARLAEILASCWGHMRSEARITEETGTHVVARGTSWDLERNVAVAFEVRRRITKRDGKRYGDDMITTASNAANSIAYRNTVFRVIPKAFWQPIYEAARKAAVGDVETIANRRAKMLAYFQKLGVPEARIFTSLQIAGVEDIGLDQLVTLKGIATAIKDGELKVDDAFPEPEATTAPPKPAQRKSEQATSQTVAAAPVVDADVVTSPATPQIGKIAKLREQGGACLVELDTSFRAATKDEALILALKTAFDAGTRLELIVTPSSDPAKYAARIDEIIPGMLEVF